MYVINIQVKHIEGYGKITGENQVSSASYKVSVDKALDHDTLAVFCNQQCHLGFGCESFSLFPFMTLTYLLK